MLKEEMDAAAARHPDVPYQPVLIDATYAGLITGAADVPLVIPALNRDGDCLSDLVMPMFGSIAGAESVLEASAAGVRTPDLGGHASTSEFTSDVITRIRTKIDVWASLGSTV
jgi:isocitrate/isopropylmalate dehydrogenase